MEAKKNILIELVFAEKNGDPITLGQAQFRRGDDPAWESLLNYGYVYRERQFVVVSGTGKYWLRNEYGLA